MDLTASYNQQEFVDNLKEGDFVTSTFIYKERDIIRKVLSVRKNKRGAIRVILSAGEPCPNCGTSGTPLNGIYSEGIDAMYVQPVTPVVNGCRMLSREQVEEKLRVITFEYAKILKMAFAGKIEEDCLCNQLLKMEKIRKELFIYHEDEKRNEQGVLNCSNGVN